MLKNYLTLIFLATSAFGIKAQFKDNYTPISNNAKINTEYLNSPNIDEFVQTSISMGFSKKEVNNWVLQVKNERNSILKTGNVYYNDVLTKYVSRVTDELLTLEPALKGKVRIYISKSPRINAFAFPDGTVIVNLGLIAAMENESQLAGVIAHELMHIKKKHMLNEQKRLSNISKQEINVDNSAGNKYRTLNFSRENELEADASSLSLLYASKFDANEMPKSLALLKEDTVNFKTDLEAFFKNEFFSVDTNWINEKAMKKKLKSMNRKESNSNIFSRPDDIYLSHPEVDKRVIAAKEILKSMNYSYTHTAPNPSEFENVKNIARFEIIHNAVLNGYYPYAIFESIRLLDEYPDNKFLKISIMKSLYWLCFYKEVGQLDKVLKRDLYQPGVSYAKLSLILSNPDLSNYRKLMYGYIKKYEEQMEKEEEYMIVLAQATESYLGKEPALFVYRRFATAFPQSNYANFVNEKLK